jgi:3-oxoacyl-[acyl-carrier-protein] synthase-3
MFQVVGANAMSRNIDYSDRSTCILFGDAAGAVVLEADSPDQGWNHHKGSESTNKKSDSSDKGSESSEKGNEPTGEWSESTGGSAKRGGGARG